MNRLEKNQADLVKKVIAQLKEQNPPQNLYNNLYWQDLNEIYRRQHHGETIEAVIVQKSSWHQLGRLIVPAGSSYNEATDTLLTLRDYAGLLIQGISVAQISVTDGNTLYFDFKSGVPRMFEDEQNEYRIIPIFKR